MNKAWLESLPPSLEAAIDALYTTFVAYPWRAMMPACPHCLQSYPGFAEPLSEIPPERLRYYLFKAMTTIGETADFKHYLPRMLDAWAREYLGAETIMHHEILGEKIEYADFAAWPDHEQEAVLRVFKELWALLLARYPIYPDAEVLLCAVGQFTSLQPWLDTWRETLTLPALAHLVALVMEPPTNAYWDSTAWGQQEYQRLLNWLAEDETSALLAIARQEAALGHFDALSQAGWVDLKGYLS